MTAAERLRTKYVEEGRRTVEQRNYYYFGLSQLTDHKRAEACQRLLDYQGLL